MLNESQMRRQVKAAKFWNTLIFCIFAALFLAVASFAASYLSQRSYTPDKWFQDRENRYKIVSSLLSKHPLVGMSEEEVTALLGPEEPNAPTSFKISHASHGEFPPETTLVYYLGVDYMDTEWLVISLENGAVSEYCIDLT